MRHSKWIGVLGVGGLVLATGLLGAPRPSWAAPSATVDTALAHPGQLVQRPWRTELAAALHALPEWGQTRTVGKTVRGKVIAGTVRLPATVEATGDLTILADVIELTAGSVRIRADGHDVNVFPVTAIRHSGTGAATAGVVTIDTSSGSTGSTGISGSPGADGIQGNDGTSASSSPNDCNNLNGGNGGAGGDAVAAGTGGAGGQGGDAGGISFPIPEGSQDSYVFIARGAQGGTGGPGGGGGNGGNGGTGGNGAYGYYECGGNGGSGGQGGKGGDSSSGDGGSGGSGGKGGDANINYPAGYDRSKVTMDLRGGDGGSGGSPGFAGVPGTGGSGGSGGDGAVNRGNDGSPGGGGIQRVGAVGSPGSPGGSGTATDSPIVTLGTDKPAYLVGESPTYTVTGAPNSPIFWTSTRNGAPTGEDHAFYGQFTNASGRATVTGGAWTDSDVGNWMKQVTISGVDGRVFFEVRMSGPWADWTALGGVLTERMGAVQSDAGITVYGRGTDNGLYVNDLNGSTWTGWRGLGGSLTSRPVPLGKYDVFARAADGSVLHGTFLPTLAPVWESLGGYIIGTPTVTTFRCPANGPPLQRCVMVLARGGDNALYVNRQRGPGDPTWTGWEYLGETLTGDPVAVNRLGQTVSVDVENQVQVFIRNGVGGLSTRLFNGTFWEGWQNLGGGIQGSPEAVAAVNYNMGVLPYTFVFIRGTDDALWVNRMENGVWTGWQSLGGVLRSDAVAVAPAFRNDTAVYASVRGTDDGFHIVSWTRAGGWAGWRAVAGSSAMAPGVVSRGNVPELLGVDKNNGRAYHRVVLG